VLVGVAKFCNSHRPEPPTQKKENRRYLPRASKTRRAFGEKGCENARVGSFFRKEGTQITTATKLQAEEGGESRGLPVLERRWDEGGEKGAVLSHRKSAP